MKTSEQINEIAAALAKAQGEIKGAKKDSENPFFKSSYADLDSVREAMQASFSKHGLSLTQDLGTNERGYTLEALLMHTSGQWISYGPLHVPVKETSNPQAVKSSTTYMRRAQLLSVCNMSEADDDGETAAQVVRNQPAVKQAPKNFAPQTKQEASQWKNPTA